MSRFDSLNRLRPSALAALYIREAPQILLLSVGLYVTATLPPSWLGRWPLVLFCVLVAVRVLGPIYRWCTRRYQVSLTHLTERAGLVQIRTRSLAWSDVTAVEVNVPWSHRMSDLAIVTVKTDGGPDTTVRLDGVDRQDAEEIRSRSRTSGGEPGTEISAPDGVKHGEDTSSAEESPLVEELSAEPVYRAGAKELLAASLFYGQFIVLACAFIGVLVQFAELFQAAPVVRSAAEDQPVLFLIIVAVFGSAVGCGLTVLRFHNFSVSRDAQTLVVEYGLFSTQQRTVRRADVIGIRLRRNLVEMLFDRARISLITTDSAQQLGTNLVLPSLPRDRVTQILIPLFPQHQEALHLERSGRRGMPAATLVTLLPVVSVICVVLAMGRWSDWTWPFALLLAAVTLMMTSAGVRLAAARFDFSRVEDGELLWSSLLGGQTKYILNLDTVHAVTALAVGSSEPESHQLFRLHFYAGMPKTLTAVVSQDHGLRAAEKSAERYGESIAASRRRKKVTS